jgi:serine/threonine protein kinase
VLARHALRGHHLKELERRAEVADVRAKRTVRRDAVAPHARVCPMRTRAFPPGNRVSGFEGEFLSIFFDKGACARKKCVLSMFSMSRPIASGSEGEVHLTAVKIKKNKVDAQREYKLQLFCASRYVMPVLYIELGDIIMMPAADMDLLTFVVSKKGALESLKLWRIVRQMITAIWTVNSRRIVHRDIKLENFVCFVNTGGAEGVVVKLCDFGFAEKLKPGEKLTARLGSHTYCAPEIIAGKPYDSKVDAWGFGVCVFTMLTMCKPFETDDYTTFDPLAMKRWRARVGALSEGQRAAVTRSMRTNPDVRSSTKDLFKLHLVPRIGGSV